MGSDMSEEMAEAVELIRQLLPNLAVQSKEGRRLLRAAEEFLREHGVEVG